jgi:hypothetical protein
MTCTRFPSAITSAASVIGVVVLGLGIFAGCRTNETGIVHPLDSGARDAPTTTDGRDAGSGTCMKDLVDKKSSGQACACSEECRSGVCAQGVCCNTACDGVCKSCNLPSGPGVCGFVAAGQLPAAAGQCQTEQPATCGLDGRCDGAGACRKYPDGSVCEAGTCQGSAVIGAKICTAGACAPGPATACSPYGCDSATGRCFNSCTSAAECDARACTSGSCGKKPLGAACSAGAECASESCADGVCCNLACTGPCVSCNQVGTAGECSPVAAGNPDPHQQCKMEAAKTCGSSGLCNGAGGCAKFAAGTECRAASCTGGSELPMAVCDGEGLCQAGTALPCAPFQCSGNACRISCTVNDDCVAPNVCTAGSCGKKPNGQICSGAGDCQSGFCVDGVCCNSNCTGTCVSCALSSSRGRCTNVPAGAADPRGLCVNKGTAACNTNGLCDGNKGCQMYPAGTVCKAASCNGNSGSATQASTCVAGACKTPGPTPCAPFKCSGTACANSCGSNADCVAPNTCINGSCGKKPNGQICSLAGECLSGFCADGFCCDSDCKASCFSCKLSGQLGKCLATTAGEVDPKGKCADQLQASCGTDGKCDGSGACRKYAAGSICSPGTCTNGMATAASTCNGTGTCVAGGVTPCTPYVCNTSGSCFNSCTASTACQAPNQCIANVCGKTGIGGTCNADAECNSGHCVGAPGGVCCDTACTGTCKSCTLTGSVGTCSNIGAGVTAPAGQCTAAPPCGLTGKCDGGGACQKAGTSTTCGTEICMAGSNQHTPLSNCDGQGSCTPVAAQSCGNIKCDPVTNNCKASCAADGDCVTPNVCNTTTGSCGLKADGSSCSGNSQCSSNHCVDGFCCQVAACGNCEACTGAGGVCANIVAGVSDPDGTCVDETAMGNACGTTGKCNGAGGCLKVTQGADCGSTCATPLLAQDKKCDGQGMCVTTATVCLLANCVNANCGNACNMANGDADCVSGKVCLGGTCQDPPPDGGM